MRRWLSVSIIGLVISLLLTVVWLAGGKIGPVYAATTETKVCGINIDPLNSLAKPSADALEGVGWVRFVFNTGNIEANNINAGFNVYDSYISELVAKGIKVMLVINHQTYWGNGSSNWNQGDFSAYARDFADKAAQISGHYGSKVAAYEIWNEPDGTGEAFAHLEPGQLSQLVEKAGAAIHNNNPNAQVLVGGFVGGDGDVNRYYNGLSAAAKQEANGVSSHPYGKEPSAGSNTLQGYIDSISGSTGAPMWLTEFANSGTSYAAAGGGTNDKEGAARYVKDFYSDLAEKYEGKVQAAILFSWNDTQDVRDDGTRFGITDASGQPKEPLYSAFFKEGCQATAKYDTQRPKELPTTNVLIYPRADKDGVGGGVPTDLTASDTLWRRYLANTQVFCAPRQIFLRTQARPMPLPNCSEAEDQGPDSRYRRDNVCESWEYPVVSTDTELDIQRLAFPLFRDDQGGISIEADLSRVDPNDTFFTAAQRNADPQYAPQFYLTTPQTQCINAVRYANYVKNLCQNYRGEGECGANLNVRFPDGSDEPILKLQAELLSSESVCLDYTAKVNNDQDPLVQAVRSIQPYTPRVFKMGFLVQHLFNYDPNFALEGQFGGDITTAQGIIQWFRGRLSETLDYLSGQPGEKIDIVPVWYHVGMAAAMFDDYQGSKSYAVDPDKQGTEFNASNTQQFVGPLLQSYLPVLQPAHQELIADNVRNFIYANNDIMRFMAQHFQPAGKVLHLQPIRSNVMFTADQVGAVSGQPEGWTRSSYDAALYIGGEHRYPLTCLNGEACFCYGSDENEQCVNQSYEDLGKAFPPGFVPNTEYLDALRRQIIYRINSGVQITHRYPQSITNPDKTENWVDGSLSMRSFGDATGPELCGLDQENVRQGYQESVSTIESSAHQNATGIIGKIITELRTKVLGYGGTNTALDRALGQPADMLKQRVEITYLVLPDDAIKISTVQNTLLQMFLNPQMYVSLIQGENSILPSKEQLAEAVKKLGGGVNTAISAHLRTNGVTRTVTAEAEGYEQTAQVQFAVLDEAGGSCEPGETCHCGGPVGRVIGPNDGNWIPQGLADTFDPSLENGCVARQVTDSSLVGVKGSFDGDTPDVRPETAGQIYALNEFVRRMAFTPLHMQPYETYPGLEAFYGGSGFTAETSLSEPITTAPGQCVYQPRDIDVLKEYGYSSDLKNPRQDPFRTDICKVAGATGVKGDYLRSILEIEASPFLRAVRGAGKGKFNPGPTTFTCGANSLGAAGIMNVIVAECSTNPATQKFSNAPNSLDPDMCTVEGAMTAAAAVINKQMSAVKREEFSSNFTYFEQLAEYYLGGDSCGKMGDPLDGVSACPGCNDYCTYVAEQATGKFAGYCNP